jgi:hypothetical protein
VIVRLLVRIAAAAVVSGAGWAAGWTTASAATPAVGPVEAAFAARSYAPGSTAVLNLRGRASRLEVTVFQAGAGAHGDMDGRPVAQPVTRSAAGSSIRLRLGDWPSGLYYAEVSTPGHGTWDAPFVLRPRVLGGSRVLVVLPTNTWQAYNFEDGDSWYENSDVHRIDLGRPFVDHGVPPHFRDYDRGFLRWLYLRGYQADFLSDDDLDRLGSAALLVRKYDLIVFSGHEEYATAHEYDLVERFRDLGGNLAFLSANDFFYKVVKHGDEMDGRWRWRDLGRPEAALVGAQYVDWNHGHYRNRPFDVTGVGKAPWLFAGTGLADGSRFGTYGIEVDSTTPSSPPGTVVLARIPSIFGPGETAEMTYYATARGAKVFSAGVMNFGGSALWPVVNTMLENLWARLTVS